jgi:hypothetical protein
MSDLNITSEPANPPAKSTPTRKRRKRRTASQIARDKKKADQVRDALAKPVSPSQNVPETPVKDTLSQVKEKAPEPIGPSPAVLSLQAQVVELVNQRSNSRQRLTQAHTAYLMAQGAFQAMQSELQGIEQEVQYQLGVIAQLENRAPSNVVSISPSYENAPTGGLGGSLQGVSSEPSATVQRPGSNLQYATGSADDLRREMRGMM